MVKRYKARPSKYKGNQLRSQLELTWARRLDRWKIKWEYEQVKLIHIYYIPDFWFPEINQFFEVKGVWTRKDLLKISYLWHYVIDQRTSIAIGQYSREKKKLVYGIVRPTPGDIVAGSYISPIRLFIDYNNANVVMCSSCKRIRFISQLGLPRCPYCKLEGAESSELIAKNPSRMRRRYIPGGINYRKILELRKRWQ